MTHSQHPSETKVFVARLVAEPHKVDPRKQATYHVFSIRKPVLIEGARRSVVAN